MHAEFQVQPHWMRTGNAYFPSAADVDGHWWVLRVNSFPDHPVWTLFVDGARRFDLNDVPNDWPNPADRELPRLPDAQVEQALAPVRDWTAYGSEVGEPCDNPFCCG